jgi:two-component system chemotaxis sensor kinase CheA
MTDSSEERKEFIQIYLEESGEEIEQLIKLLLELEQQPDDMETLREAFRLLHTFKGSSGMMGFDRINALAHELESRFDACRSGREQMTSETVSVVLGCVDFMRDFLDRLAGGNEDQGDPAPLIEALAGVVALPMAPREPAVTAAPQIGGSSVPAARPAAGVEAEPQAIQARPQREPAAGAAVVPPHHDLPPAPPPRPAREKIISSAAISDSRPVRVVTVAVRLSDQVELPDLKARLIVARLQALGDILGVDPPLQSIDEARAPITLRLQVRSAADDHVFTKALDIEGIVSVTVSEGAEPAALQQRAAPADRPRDEHLTEEAKPEAARVLPTDGAAAAKPAPKRSSETIRVGIDRLDRLMNLAGELVVTNARFDQLADEMRLLFRSGGSIEAGSPLAESLLRAMARYGGTVEGMESVQDAFAGKRITGIVGDDGGSQEGAALRRGWMERGRRVASQVSETVDQLARLSRSIQQAVLETRMVPIGPMFNRFRRTVRDIAMKQNKDVLLELDGEMTELDKRMVDELGDPMIHLIRNAVDHGIEPAAVRVRSGKPPEGLIRLRAYHQSNHVVIEIQDDGAGIDVAKVRVRALQRGLASEAELNMMSQTELYGFIWHAGFSTADKVSDISGRGVGMDVVRDRISTLGGVVELASEPGQGSTISIRLPLTLSIVNAMIVRFRGFRLAIPMTDVFEIYGLSRSEIFTSQGREMIDARGRLLPLYQLDELFSWNDYLPAGGKQRNGLVQAVLVRHGHRSLAIEVDDLDGNSDIVIKSLDEHFSHIPGLGGACVMGDGEVCLVLDTAGLRLKTGNRQRAGEPATGRSDSPAVKL